MFDVLQNRYWFTDAPADCKGEVHHSGPAIRGVTTSGLGPCVGVAYLNVTQRVAGVLHVSGASQLGGALVVDFFSEAHARTGDRDRIEFWIGGGNDSDPAIRKSVRADRATVMADLAQAFPNAKAQPVWLTQDQDAYTVTVVIDPSMQIVTYHSV